jgi:hypothetical protein
VITVFPIVFPDLLYKEDLYIWRGLCPNSGVDGIKVVGEVGRKYEDDKSKSC